MVAGMDEDEIRDKGQCSTRVLEGKASSFFTSHFLCFTTSMTTVHHASSLLSLIMVHEIEVALHN